jgi:pimeloyl-ACP methyl ester carboxylesterase
LEGAKEALRQATYWEMKNRAGVVGRGGLGPLLGRLAKAAPGIRVHLIGHSFGARLVSYALAGLPDDGPSPVASVTVLQGAFSHFAFATPLPFDAGRHGALAGMEARIQGPLTVCFSTHDGAVGRFYPLASIVARDDTAGGHDALYRWGGMGADGAQNADAVLDRIQPPGAGATYRFARNRILNVDASDIVRRGGPPSGAHSDIVHPELTWIVLAASRA